MSEKCNRWILLYLKVVNLSLGVIIVVLGFHSYVNSTWTNDVDMENILPEPQTMKAYQICTEENWNYIKKTYWNNSWTFSCGRSDLEKCQQTCPSIAFEVWFLVTASTWLILTLINSLAFLLCDTIWRILVEYWIEYLYNFISFMVLLVGGIYYMGTASGIDRVLGKLIEEVGRKDGVIPSPLKDTGSFLSGEKYAAGVLMIVQSSLHFIMNICVAFYWKYL